MPDHKLFLQENSYLFQEMFRIFQMRKMSGFRDHSGFNGRIQLLVFLCDKRSGSFFFSGNNIDACIGRFYGIINADIQVFANNRTGLLVDLSKVFTERKIDMRTINSRTNKQEKATISISFEIGSKEELASLIEKLRQIESVLDVERGTPG